MKSLPEKIVLATIILSCGFVTHSDPSAPGRIAKRAPVAAQHTWHAFPATETTSHPTRVAKAFGLPEESP